MHDHEKFDEASMKRRWKFDDGIFDAMCKWALTANAVNMPELENQFA